jgi:membrane protease YdiL (CAAX protease family)
MLTERKWKLETVPHLLLGLFVSVLLGSVIVFMLTSAGKGVSDQQRTFLVLMANATFVHGALLVMIAVFLRFNHVTWSNAFGFGRASLNCLLLPIASFCLILPTAWFLSRLSAHVIRFFHQDVVVQMPVQFLQARTPPPAWETAFVGFSTIFLAPIVEEMLFRGILYPSIKQAGFPRVALFGTSFLFAIYHSNLMILAPLFLLAVALVLVYEATDNLLSAILLHALFNAANYVVLVLNWDIEATFRRLMNCLLP